MWLSDVSVKRPVLATVISLMLVAFGTLSFQLLPLREYPDINPPLVSIRTSYVGASAEVIETRITQVIEDQINGIEGIKSINSTSSDERSRVTVEFELDRDMEESANDVRDRVATITLNRPDRLNAMNQQMKEDLRDCWQRVKDDPDVWVAIVTGAGRAFSSGADVQSLDS